MKGAARRPSGPRTRMETTPVAGVRNLTQVEAAERARLLDVTVYDISLDLTDGTGGPGEGTFRSVTEIRFTLRRAGRVTFIEAAAERLRSATLNGERGRHLRLVGREGPDPAPASPPTTRSWSTRDFPYSTVRPGPAPQRRPGRQGGLPLQPVRDRRRAAGLRLLRPARPQERLHLARHRARALEGHLQLAGRPRSTPAPVEGTKVVHFAQSARMSTYITALCAGPYHEVRDTHDGIDLGLFVPGRR